MTRALLVAFLMAFSLMPVVTHALDIQVSGAGTAGANGCYDDQGDGTFIEQSSEFWLYAPAADTTICRVGLYNSTTSQYYFSDTATSCDTSAEFVAATYSVSAGTGPAPTLTETTCTDPTPVDTSATSTADQAQQNLSTAMILFFVAMFGMIWLMRKH